MDSQLKKSHEQLFLYVTVVRLLWAQRWKTMETSVGEEWVVKIAECAEIAKLICFD